MTDPMREAFEAWASSYDEHGLNLDKYEDGSFCAYATCVALAAFSAAWNRRDDGWREIAEAREYLAALSDLTPDQHSKAQCGRLHEALLHVSFLLAKADGVPQSRRTGSEPLPVPPGAA